MKKKEKSERKEVNNEMFDQLAKKAVRGNVDAYGELIEQYKEYLYRTAFLYTKNEDDALDMVSECVLKGFKNIKTLKEPMYFKTWLTRILINTIKDSYNKQVSLVSVDLLQNEAGEEGLSKEEKLDLYWAIDCLQDKFKTVIVLKYFSDMKLSEIAYVMDIPEGTVSAYLTRAKNELKKILKEDYHYA